MTRRSQAKRSAATQALPAGGASCLRLSARLASTGLIVCMLLVSSGTVWAQEVSREAQVKAVFLWRLAQFVHWPSNAFASADSPLVIGVIGSNPFGEALEIAVRNETAHNRRVITRTFRRVSEVDTCHVLFISQSEAGRARQITRTLKERNVLTVGDIENFTTEHGGMVRFISEGNKIKLRINIDAAREAGLEFDARLLRISEVVRTK